MFQALKKLLPGSKPPVEYKPDWAWTPDQAILEQYYAQLVFIPDDLKRKGRNHQLIRDVGGGEPKNDSVYTSKKFYAFNQDLGKDPETKKPLGNMIVLPGDYKPSGFLWDPPPAARVQGELYSVESRKIYLLDKAKENGVKYSRVRVRIIYPWRYVGYNSSTYPENTIATWARLPHVSDHAWVEITAWMYVGIPKYWDPMIGGVFAKPAALHEHTPPRPWIGEHYRFEVK